MLWTANTKFKGFLQLSSWILKESLLQKRDAQRSPRILKATKCQKAGSQRHSLSSSMTLHWWDQRAARRKAAICWALSSAFTSALTGVLHAVASHPNLRNGTRRV